MKIQRCKGTKDLSPEEMATFRAIEDIFRDSCLGWGYREVRTPTIEYLHLFTSTGTLTPSRLSRVYSFLDWDGWSGERVVLRPDGTIPVARLYVESMEGKIPARLFYVANVFIFEATGRQNRERWQLGAELIGSGSPIADAELIMLALEVLKRLGLKGIELRLSHIGLIRTLLEGSRLSPEEQAKVLDRILDGDSQELTRLRQEDPELGRILSQLESEARNPQLITKLPELKGRIDDFFKTLQLLDKLGCEYRIDLTSGRGFEYYTGIIFQLFQGGERLGGGGRYDALIPLLGGKETPACGFALYLDRLMERVKPEALSKGKPQSILVLVETEALEDGFSLASQLRQAGYLVQLGGGQTDFDWRLEVRNKPPRFILTDQGKQRVELDSAEAVLKILGGRGG